MNKEIKSETAFRKRVLMAMAKYSVKETIVFSVDSSFSGF
jgi:hypothetical protein